MSKSVMAVRDPAGPYNVTRDVLTSNVSADPGSSNFPLHLVQAGTGTTNDANAWGSLLAVLRSVTLSFSNGVTALVGGSARVDAYVEDYAEWSGAGGAWVAVTPNLGWRNGQDPFSASGLISDGAVILAVRAGGASRLRLVVAGTTDTVEALLMVSPIAANPSCP